MNNPASYSITRPLSLLLVAILFGRSALAKEARADLPRLFDVGWLAQDIPRSFDVRYEERVVQLGESRLRAATAAIDSSEPAGGHTIETLWSSAAKALPELQSVRGFMMTGRRRDEAFRVHQTPHGEFALVRGRAGEESGRVYGRTRRFAFTFHPEFYQLDWFWEHEIRFPCFRREMLDPVRRLFLLRDRVSWQVEKSDLSDLHARIRLNADDIDSAPLFRVRLTAYVSLPYVTYLRFGRLETSPIVQWSAIRYESDPRSGFPPLPSEVVTVSVLSDAVTTDRYWIEAKSRDDTAAAPGIRNGAVKTFTYTGNRTAGATWTGKGLGATPNELRLLLGAGPTALSGSGRMIGAKAATVIESPRGGRSSAMLRVLGVLSLMGLVCALRVRAA